MDSTDRKFEIAMAEFLAVADYDYVENKPKNNNKIRAYGGYFIILMLLAMVGLYTTIRVLNYADWLQGVLIKELLTIPAIMIVSSFCVWLFCLCFECEAYTLKGFLGFSVILMMLIYGDSKFLNNSIADYWVSGECHWGYELLILPINAFYTLKLCESIEREWSVKSNILGLLCFVVWQIFLCHLCDELYMSYQGSLVVTNTIILANVLFTAKTKRRNFGNRFAMLGIYVGTMVMSIYLKKDGMMSLTDYLFDEPGFSRYVESINTLFRNSKWFGAAYEGISVEMDVLRNSSNSIHSVCVYYGRIPALIYYVLLIVVMIIFGIVVYQSRKENRLLFIVGIAAYSNLSMRMILGTLFSLAISPLQVEMMYIGANRMIDYCSTSILLMLYFINKAAKGYVPPFEQVKDDILKKIVEFYVLDEDDWEEINDEDLF